MPFYRTLTEAPSVYLNDPSFHGMAKLKQIYPKYYLYNRLVNAKLFIDKNYNTNINLHNIAREGYFSKFHFIRLFKLIFGHTPHQYLIHVRIENARELLRQG